MLRLTLKNLWAHKLRLAFTGVAVVLGVAFMTGTMVLTDTMGNTFDNMLATSNAGIDVVVQQPETVDAQWGDARERVPAATLDVIRGVDGVDAAAGSIQGFAQLVKADGTVGSLDGLGATIGTNWVANAELNPLSLASGRAPRDGEVVLDRNTVTDQGWSLGDRITVLAKGRPERLTLVGTASFGDVGGMPGSSLVAVSDAAAQRMFAQPGTYDSVAISAAEGVSPTKLAASIDRALGKGHYDVLTGKADTAAKQHQLSQDLSFFNTFLLAFALVSLFVGTFIIYNTFSILVAQRTRDTAMLRAIGAGRRQILRSLVAESAVVGMIAGAVGLGVGVALSFGLKALLGAFGLEIPSGPTVVSTATIVTAFVVGVSVTVVSALAPAVRASRVRPIAALRDVAVDRSAVSVTRTVLGMVMGGAGIALSVAATSTDSKSAPQMIGLGIAATFLGVFVLGPVIARPVVRLIGWPVARGGVTGSLARENATRSPKRTAATSSALMVGVALVGFITILAASTKASVEHGVDRSFRADYLIESGAFGEGGFNPSLANEVAHVPGVESVAGLRNGTVSAFGRSTMVQATDTRTIDGLYDLKVSSGSMADVGQGEVAVRAATAEAHHLTVGDTLDLTFARTGEVPLKLAAIYDDTMVDSNYLVDLSTFEANVTDQYDTRIFVGTESGVDAATSRAALKKVLAPYPNADLQDQAQFKEGITSQIDKMLNLIYGLLALAVVIALLGIANTLALSIHERRREIGLLRAVGMTRAQVRRTVRWESVFIALLGTALGTGLALAGAWSIIKGLADQDVTAFVVPGTQLGVIVVLAAAAGVLAAVGPARRAARMDVLAAISS